MSIFAEAGVGFRGSAINAVFSSAIVFQQLLTTPYPTGVVFPNENEDLVIIILMLRNIA